MAARLAQYYKWSEIPAEPLKGGITRKLISSERLMIAHVWLQGTDGYLRR